MRAVVVDGSTSPNTSGTAEVSPRPTRRGQPRRRFGYLVAIGVNVAMLYVTHHLLEWEWSRFLTSRFSDVVPIITASLILSIVANAIYLGFDPDWFRALVDAAGSVISLVVLVRLLQIFPFDFSSYDHDWSGVAKVVLVLGMIGSVVGLIASTVKARTGLAHRRVAARW